MVGDQAIDWLRRNYRKARFVDQDALNVLLEGRLHYLPEDWNRPAGDGVWLEPGSASRDDVRLVHFAGTQKPWHYRFRHPLKMEYYRYLSMTPFADTPPVGRSPGRVLREIRRTIQFVLYHPRTIPWLFNLEAMRTRVLYNDQNWPTP
jgi:UDP-glucose:(glucosyl)LPS alpha-1,3-glucosyltransferase